MQTQNKTKPINIVVMITMIFCIVFAPSLKYALDSASLTKKATIQQLLEEEISEKESKIEKEVYTKYNSSLALHTKNENSICLSSCFQSPLKITKPYLKVHTPPPDFFISFI